MLYGGFYKHDHSPTMLEVDYLPPQPPDEVDYAGRFVACGILLLLMALMSGCVTALVPVGYALQRSTAPLASSAAGGPAVQPLSQVALGMGMYLTVTVLTGWLGVAALMKLRYVRPLVLILGTHALLLGLITLLVTGAMLPVLTTQMPQNTGGVALIGFVIGMGLVLLFMVAPPSVLLLLMRPDAVQITAERYDLKRRWTDGVPLKVLGLVVTLAIFAGFELFLLARPALPMPGSFLTGAPAVVLILAHVALLVWATVRVYCRDVFGWRLAFWALVVPLTLFTVSAVTMPTERYLAVVQDQPGVPEMIAGHERLFRTLWTAMSGLFLVATIVYLLPLRRAVARTPDTPSGTSLERRVF